jgi:hypothetical protein
LTGSASTCDVKCNHSASTRNSCGSCGLPTVANCADYHVVFITSTTFAPTFGSLANADARCQQLAQQAGRSGTWRAILVNASTTLAQRVRITKPVFNTRDELVAVDSAEFFTGQARHAPSSSETGGTVDTVAWVGSSQNDCTGWTATTSSVLGAQALSTQLDRWLFGASSGPCSLSRSLYCIDQD